jgi:CBS domain-containing protein
MPWTPSKLEEIAAAVKAGEPPTGHSARELIGWFNSARRGRVVVAMVRRHLKKAGIQTRPDFEYAYLDEPLTFVVDDGATEVKSQVESVSPPLVVPTVSAIAMADPTYRVGKLESANTSPVSISPDATVAQAITTMLYHDYSQLPVMQSEFSLKGAVSWKSIGRALALGHLCSSVRDCLEEAAVISSDTSLFAAIPTIVEKEYVLVKDAKNRIGGIVTTTDLSLQFRQLAEPFLLLGEIENHLRRLSDGKFSQSDVSSVKDPSDAHRVITDLSDLTFGEHIRLLENPERWGALGLRLTEACS